MGMMKKLMKSRRHYSRDRQYDFEEIVLANDKYGDFCFRGRRIGGQVVTSESGVLDLSVFQTHKDEIVLELQYRASDHCIRRVSKFSTGQEAFEHMTRLITLFKGGNMQMLWEYL